MMSMIRVRVNMTTVRNHILVGSILGTLRMLKMSVGISSISVQIPILFVLDHYISSVSIWFLNPKLCFNTCHDLIVGSHSPNNASKRLTILRTKSLS